MMLLTVIYFLLTPIFIQLCSAAANLRSNNGCLQSSCAPIHQLQCWESWPTQRFFVGAW